MCGIRCGAFGGAAHRSGLDVPVRAALVIGSLIAFVLIAVLIGGAVCSPSRKRRRLSRDADIRRVVQEWPARTRADVRSAWRGQLRIGALKDPGTDRGHVLTGPGETVPAATIGAMAMWRGTNCATQVYTSAPGRGGRPMGSNLGSRPGFIGAEALQVSTGVGESVATCPACK